MPTQTITTAMSATVDVTIRPRNEVGVSLSSVFDTILMTMALQVGARRRVGIPTCRIHHRQRSPERQPYAADGLQTNRGLDVRQLHPSPSHGGVDGVLTDHRAVRPGCGDHGATPHHLARP